MSNFVAALRPVKFLAKAAQQRPVQLREPVQEVGGDPALPHGGLAPFGGLERAAPNWPLKKTDHRLHPLKKNP